MPARCLVVVFCEYGKHRSVAYALMLERLYTRALPDIEVTVALDHVV